MIKGVNRQIIEVNNPESIYFERAVFYLKPGVKLMPEQVMRRELERYVTSIGEDYGRKKRRLRAGALLIVFMIGIAAAAVLYLLIAG